MCIWKKEKYGLNENIKHFPFTKQWNVRQWVWRSERIHHHMTSIYSDAVSSITGGINNILFHLPSIERCCSELKASTIQRYIRHTRHSIPFQPHTIDLWIAASIRIQSNVYSFIKITSDGRGKRNVFFIKYIAKRKNKTILLHKEPTSNG